MPARPAIMQLPEDVRAELDRRLIQGGFAGYEALATWLAEQGWQVSKSAVHRYGQRFEDRVRALKVATDQAKAIVESSPDDEGAISEALMRLVQEKLFQVLLDFEVQDVSKLNLGTLARSIAELGRASVTQKKWQSEVRERITAKLVAMEAESQTGKGRRFDAETLRIVREEIYGIVS